MAIAADPADDTDNIEAFLDALWLEKGLAQNTLDAYGRDLRAFSTWLRERERPLTAARREDLLSYLAHRYETGAQPRSTARALSSLKRFYQRLARETGQEDPTLKVESPKLGRTLPGSLTEGEVERLLLVPDLATPIGMRDRTMLEVLYACGLRVSELVALEITDLNLRQGVTRVMGKGRKERLVPMGEEALSWLHRYLAGARVELLRGHATSAVVFPSNRGTAMTRQTFWHLIKKHALQARIERKLSPHTLRHAFATHLVNHGADLRVVQLLLGHSDLSTTQIYTHIARQRKADLHEQHHPRG